MCRYTIQYSCTVRPSAGQLQYALPTPIYAPTGSVSDVLNVSKYACAGTCLPSGMHRSFRRGRPYEMVGAGARNALQERTRLRLSRAHGGEYAAGLLLDEVRESVRERLLGGLRVGVCRFAVSLTRRVLGPRCSRPDAAANAATDCAAEAGRDVMRTEIERPGRGTTFTSRRSRRTSTA